MEEDIKKELFSYVGDWLHETAWMSDLPIHPSIGLEGFFSALSSSELEVATDSKKRTCEVSCFWIDRFYRTAFSFDQILEGWKNHPPSSPKSFYDSIYHVFDMIGMQIPKSNKNNWAEFRNGYPKEIRNRMEDNWFPYFIRHQEHMLMTLDFNPLNATKTPELSTPVIFDEAIKEYPLFLHAKVRKWNSDSDGCSLGPCPEYLDEHNFHEDFNANYHPSESALHEYFFGIYLEKLAKAKSYEVCSEFMNASVSQRRRSLILRGHQGLSGQIQWRNVSGIKNNK